MRAIESKVTAIDIIKELMTASRESSRPVPRFTPDTNGGGVGGGGTGGGIIGRYRELVTVPDGTGFLFVDDGAGNPVYTLESLGP